MTAPKTAGTHPPVTEWRSPSHRPRGSRVRSVLVLTLTLVVLVGLGSALWWRDRGSPTRPTAPPSMAATSAPAPVAQRQGAPQPVPGKVMVGAYLSLKGMSDEQALAYRRTQLGLDPRILHRYYGWSDPLPQSRQGIPSDSILMISWDGAPYRSINNGSQDALIRKAADALAAYREPVFLRWAWEMNGNWYNWGGAENGDNPAAFVTAWRHIHDIFRARGATNVAWVWGPNCFSVPQAGWNDMTAYYPGDTYVDWVGVSGYFNSRETPDYLFGPVMKRYAGRKPIMLAETGALEKGGTVKADWISALASWITAHPSVAALVWFDTDNDKGNTKNWRIDSTPGSLAAYRRLLADPHFQG